MRTGLISKASTHLIKVVSEVATKKRDGMTINGDDYETHDGTPIRDFIHVSDLADIHLIAAKHLISGGQSDLFNCGYGIGYSVKEVIAETNNILEDKIKFKIGSRRPGDSMPLTSNTDKFFKSFGWKPKYNNLNYIIKTSINWEKNICKIYKNKNVFCT